MKNKGFVILLIAVLIMSAGCSQKENDVLRIGSMPTFSATIYAVGVEQGFFTEEGLDVELTVFRSALERDAAATSGNLDGFMTDMMGAAALYNKDFEFVMTSSEYEDFGIMVAQGTDDATIESGAKTGISNNTIIEYVMDNYLMGDHEKVNIVAVPDRMAALLNGELDLGIFPQPFIGIIMGNGGKVVASTAEAGLQPVVLVFDKALVEDNPEQVEAFYSGYAKAINFIKDNDFDAYKDVMVKYGLATEETVDRMRLPIDQFGLTVPSESDYEAIMAWMVDRGAIDTVPSFDDICVTRFVTN